MRAQLLTCKEIMEKFDAASCCGFYAVLGQYSQVASIAANPASIGEVLEAYQSGRALQEFVPAEMIEQIKLELLLPAIQFCHSAELKESRKLIDSILQAQFCSSVRNSELQWTLHNLQRLMRSEMSERQFFSISGDLASIFDMEQAMGDAVFRSFPSARQDISEAAKCLALQRNTASAFHLMRAAEVGLWELGKDRQIPLAQSERIEFSEWGRIIEELEPSIKTIQQWPNSRAKEDAHKFYNCALVEIRAFNDGWRRHAAHARPHQPPMSDDEAKALWGHVTRFMQGLATKISEDKHTKIRWE